MSETDVRATIGRALLRYQQSEDISQKELANRLGISTAQLRRYVNQQANMSLKVLYKISELTDLHFFSQT